MDIAPEPDEIEVSLFGPGYGESIVLHLGKNNWFIIDSCVDPTTKKSVPLEYLRQIQVDPATAVRQVIATHWHDDHVRGIGQVFAACERAQFVCSGALRQNEFFTLVNAYGQRSMMRDSGVQEFYNVIQTLKARSQSRYLQSPVFATVRQCIWPYGVTDSNDSSLEYTSGIYALSPSDASILLAHQHIATLIPHDDTKLRVLAQMPNHAAVVLWITIGDVFVLLGSDLEETTHPGTGWTAILGSSTHPKGKASIFKIPHHGSQTADQPKVWQDMLQTEPYAILTPFVLGKVLLPTNDDADRLCDRTENAFVTAVPRHRRRRGRPSAVEKTIRETVRSIWETASQVGHIRLRANLANLPLTWRVDLFGEARPLRQI